MSSFDYREPTNDELWAQPPASAHPSSSPQGLAPIPHVPLPAPVPHAPAPVPIPTERADRTVFVLARVSRALGIPLTAISSAIAGLPGLLAVWVGIVLVNFIYARSRQH